MLAANVLKTLNKWTCAHWARIQSPVEVVELCTVFHEQKKSTTERAVWVGIFVIIQGNPEVTSQKSGRIHDEEINKESALS